MRYRTRSSTGIEVLLLVVLVTLGLGIRAQAARSYSPFPKPDAGYVTDAADLLSDKQEEELETWLAATEKTRGVEIIVVTIGSIRDYPGAPNRSIEEFARGLFDAYGIGNLPANNEVLLLVSSRDREARIELGGAYGNRRNAAAVRIMNGNILPRFREGRYAEGITSGTQALIREFAGPSGGRRPIDIPRWAYWAVIGAMAVLVPAAISLFRNGKRSWGWVVIGMSIVLVLVVWWLVRRIGDALPDSDGSSRLGGSRGFGGGFSRSPGGFGGFGGGFSSGGGATGRW